MRHWQQSSRRALALAAVVLAVCIVLTRVAAGGPPGHTVRVGFLENIAPTFDPAANPAHREFVEGLRELGYTPGRDVVVEFKSAEGNIKLWPELAAGLVSSKPDMLVTPALGPTLAAAKATKTVPIIMVGATDVVETGLVASLARPGGNITGLAINAAEIAAKRVQLLQEAVPNASRIAVLWNATLPGMALGFQNIDRASPQLGVTIQSVRVSGSGEFDQAFAAIESGHPDGLVVLFGPLRGDDLPRIVEFVTQHKIPTIFELGRGVRGGGLMEFGPNSLQMFRRAAFYVDKIANGADPATLPVEEPSQFELVINLKSAKSMGIAIPQSLLLRADRIVE
jgi:putative tryptophan/tyrosine transport system substrate-binding protein